MRTSVLFLFIFLYCFDANAKPRYRSTYTSSMSVMSSNQTIPTYSNKTAQGVADIMAQRGYVGHFGGNTGYEGCGSGMTQSEAYRNCCFANSNLTTVDVGYAQGRDGRWYCCRRYR